MDDLRGRIAELTAEGHRALVFSQYVDDHGVRHIADGLKRFAPLVYTGEMSVQERRDTIARFERGGHGVLVLSLLAGGQGLNLQCATYIFHFDRWWNPALERQAEDRTHRIGQASRVHVYRYRLLDSIEERICGLLEDKQALFADIVDTASMDLSHLVSKGELCDLLGLEGE
jgi:SNF2 family DNA or RNA helicase